MNSILDHPLISSRYFFPRPGPLDPPYWVAAKDARLACHLAKAHDEAPWLVHFHGNGEVVADYVPDLVDAWLARGINVFLAEYRGYGMSTGDPALATMLDDVDAVVVSLGMPLDRVVVYGRSVGSIFALELCRRHPECAGLIVESGIADPLERLLLRVSPQDLGVTEAAFVAEVNRLLDHERKLRGFPNPALVLHARHDHLVDVSHGERLADWAGGGGELVVFESGDHNSILLHNGAQILDRGAAFIERVTGASGRETGEPDPGCPVQL